MRRAAALAALLLGCLSAGCDAPLVPVASAFGPGALCGNGKVDADETVETCPVDVCASCKDLACLQKLCDDGNPCTTDLCDPVVGCGHLPSSGGPCDEEQPCLVKPVCEKGVCVGPSGLWHALLPVDVTQSDQLDGAVPDGAGGMFAVGRVTRIKLQGHDVFDAIWRRIDAKGQVIAEWKHHDDKHGRVMKALAGLADGRMLAVGSERTLVAVPAVDKAASWPRWDQLTASGAVVHGATYKGMEAAGYPWADLMAVAVNGKGRPLMVGHAAKAVASDGVGLVGVPGLADLVDPWWLAVDPADAEGSAPKATGQLLAASAAPAAPGEWFAAGFACLPGVDVACRRGWVVRVADGGLSDPGKVKAARIVAPEGMHAIAFAVEGLEDGGALLAGICGEGDPVDEQERGWLTRLGPDLKPKWSWIDVKGTRIGSGIRLGPASWLAHASTRAGQTTTTALLRWSLDGRLVSRGSHPLTHTRALVDLGEGRVGLVGTNHYYGFDAMAAIVDIWGHASCAEKGACAASSANPCSDGDPCTLDGCEASMCKYEPAPVDRNCNPATSTCDGPGECEQ